MAIKVIVELHAEPGRRTELKQEAMASGVYAPLAELLTTPFRATVIRQLP
jgi:hypothetical protein